jgi:tight adherence protein C
MTVLAAVWICLVVDCGWLYRRRPTRMAVALGWLLSTLWLPLAALPSAAALAHHRLRAIGSAHRDRRHITTDLPDAVDLLLVAIHAGLTPELALRRLTPYLSGVLQSAALDVFARTDAGERFGDALEALTSRLGEPVRPLVAALTGSERYGLPLGPALDVVATVTRDQRRRAAETAARRLPVRLSFPLVLCILPAFIILTVVPAIFGALRALP